MSSIAVDSGGGGGLPVIQPDVTHMFVCEKLRATMSFRACIERRARKLTHSGPAGFAPSNLVPLHPECQGCVVGERNAKAFAQAKLRRFRPARFRLP